ncbi:MAG TPA: acyl-CoA dehydrogenase [Gemmatimonadales bacterium]|jgi:alkylation response protein AidB-like acyl-CoA dehydrogenase|nr:acyl-CoA dehydrogenase [Gemmatimonadales bacterium]
MTEMLTRFPALTMLSEEEELFRQSVREFAAAEVLPHVREMDEAGVFRPDLIRMFFELGLMGIEVPEPWGGAGATIFLATLAIEELARVDASAAIYVDVQNTLVNNCLLRWGNEEQKVRYFPRLTSALLGAFALSEPGSGSDAFGLQTRAERRGDHWRLTGRKFWITNGGEAGFFIVFANTDFSKAYKGITGFLVEREFEGFAVGKKENKLGIRASSTCELILEECRVPEENVLGPVGVGYKISIETLNEGRIGIGAQMVGVAQGALDAALAYVKERKQFGKRIAEFQGVQFQLAQMRTELEAARLMVYNAARLKDGGRPFTQEAAMAKLFSSQVADRITSKALELFGGYGYSKEYPVEKFYRDAKIGTIYEGTSNMQLLTIAKAMVQS